MSASWRGPTTRTSRPVIPTPTPVLFKPTPPSMHCRQWLHTPLPAPWLGQGKQLQQQPQARQYPAYLHLLSPLRLLSRPGLPVCPRWLLATLVRRLFDVFHHSLHSHRYQPALVT